MNTLVYTQQELGKIHKDAATKILSTGKRGDIVVKTWQLKVTNHCTVLITPYSVKCADGTWTDETYATIL